MLQVKITAALRFPARIEPGEPADVEGGMPKTLKRRLAITQSVQTSIARHSFELKPWPDEPLPETPGFDHFELVSLSTKVEGDDHNRAVELIAPEIEYLLDIISFQIQFPVTIAQLEALDVTGQPVEGEERRFLLYPFPNGYPLVKFRASQVMGSTTALESPLFFADTPRMSEKVEAALRWYTKALAAGCDTDKFAFLWICLEILATIHASDLRLPYRAPCGHEIPSCPQCGQKTERRIGGKVMIGYLSDQLGVEPSDAKALWNTRMLFHGANHLTSKAVSEVPRLNNLLRAAVTLAMKRTIGHPDDAPPVVSPVAAAFAAFTLGGTRAVTASDLAGLPG